MSAKPKGRNSNKDPYFQAKQQLENKINSIEKNYEEWKFIFENKNTASDPKFERLNKDILTIIPELKSDMKNLHLVIGVVEKNRATFPHIDDTELHNRKTFISTCETKVKSINDFVNSERVRNKIASDKRKELTSSGTELTQGRSTQNSQYGDNMITARRNDMKQKNEETDAVLEDMSAALDRLSTASTTVNTKLLLHQELISEMDEEMTKTEGLMETSLAKMDVLLAKSKGGKLCCIVVLAIIMILFFFLLIYV